MRDSKTEILHFWFDETEPRQWFQKNDAFDEAISARFMNIYRLARDGVCDAWRQDANGCLALCIVLDQFPRNMFRNSAEAFATDEKALLVAKHAVAKGYDQTVALERRRFIYLPYEHSENLSDQRKGVELFSRIRDEDPVSYDYAQRHYKVIERFGRFPHRNAALGRDTTPDEAEYLAADGGF